MSGVAATVRPVARDAASASAGDRLPFHNQLEPTSLIDAFVRHPPRSFEVISRDVDGLPAFAAPFDLLTTADAALRLSVQRLPLHRHWSKLLRPRVAFVGTTVSEYALLRRGEGVRECPARWKAQWGSLYPFLIVKDLPQSSPLLDEDDNRLTSELTEACREQGFFLVEGQALAYVTIDFDDLSVYLERLSKSRRYDLRRKMRSLSELETGRIRTGDARFADERTIDEYFAMYLAVYAQSTTQFDLLTREFFAAVLRDGSSGGVVFEYRRRGAGAPLVGWNLCFVTAGKLVDKYIGLAYSTARELNLYFVSWIVNLQFAIDAGLSHYVAGWSDPEVKAQLGAEFTFTRHAVYTRHDLLRAVGRRLTRRLEGDRTRLRQWT